MRKTNVPQKRLRDLLYNLIRPIDCVTTEETLFRRKMSFVEYCFCQLRRILRSFEEILLFLMEAKRAENYIYFSKMIKKTERVRIGENLDHIII